MASESSMSGLDRARAFVETQRGRRQNQMVVNGFPPVTYWGEENVPMADVLASRTPPADGSKWRTGLYVGTPYCPKTDPAKCGYCLFPVQDYTGNADLEEYLGFLGREARLYRGVFDRNVLSTVFFGGGTSNLYRPERYAELLALVRETFPNIAPDADITLEGLPALFSREKVQRLREAGFNRVSMGAQQMNDELNKLSGRKQTARNVVEAVEWCRSEGLGCNVDLIFGWPRQTVASMVDDLEKLIATGVDDITHYELHVGGPTDFALNRRDELPSTAGNLELYRVSRDLLKSLGFRQLTAYNWRRASYDSPFVEGAFQEIAEYWGFGYAAVSHVGATSGWLLKNQTSLSEYKGAIAAGRFPNERGYRLEPVDRRLAYVIRTLQEMAVDRARYRARLGSDVVQDFGDAWQALAEVGFVEIDDEAVRLVGDGVFYTPLVQLLLASERLAELRLRYTNERRRLVSIGQLLGSSLAGNGVPHA
jgi:oxygen-independent coproporphyrinogen III oxidase